MFSSVDDKYIKIDYLYKAFEVKLENIADKLLESKLNDRDNVLLNVQTIIEKTLIHTAMKKTDNNISKAAKLLGINRNTLSKKLRENGG